MRKGKNRSTLSVRPPPVSEPEPLPLDVDVLTVKIKSLRIADNTSSKFSINVTFYDQLILNGILRSTPARTVSKEKTVLMGSMPYDPSDYERMCLIPDHPLCVQIQPIQGSESTLLASASRLASKVVTMRTTFEKSAEDLKDISCCNIDILPLFLGRTKIHVKKRMQPLIKTSVLYQKSWDNLPLLNIKVEVTRNENNVRHHNVLKEANVMKLTLIGAYNMLVPYNEEYVYTAASRLPLQNENDFGLMTFNQGKKLPKRFRSINFNPEWESLRVGENFTQGDVMFETIVEDIQNDDDIPLQAYLDDPTYSTIWGSFHRTLVLDNADSWLWKNIRRYHWPIEVHIYGETQGFSFMAFLNLFKLLYPGEDTVRIAVPLQFINSETMQRMCGCELMLTPNSKASSANKTRSDPPLSPAPITSSRDTSSFVRVTGSYENNAFVLVVVQLGRPLRRVVIPPVIFPMDLSLMLEEMEQAGPQKRECTGRGQQNRDWQFTVKNAAAALRKVPYYGMTEFCNFNRQLSETRTRVELMTSCWQDAAVFVNNNFIVQDFLQSDETYEEMLMMAHACLMRTACVTLVGEDKRQDIDPTLRAARHARHMQDIAHATELYLQLVAQKPRDANCWRELSTCLKDVDRDWASVCINKSVVLDPRHPLSLLSKGCMLSEEDPDLAEPFFVALLGLCPYWSTGWVVASVYYHQRQLFHMAGKILEYKESTIRQGKTEHLDFPRSWEHELGDWWDSTPILPGMSPYYNAADCLLRLRAFGLAEACVSLVLCEGETAAYYHLLALCCRLQGNIKDALCHLRTGIDKYGEISYLRSLEAECCHKLNDIPGANAAFDKAGSASGSFSILLSTPCRDQQRARAVLVDLSRRQPSAYVWIALAYDWMKRAAAGEVNGEPQSPGEFSPASFLTYASLCAIQALKYDRRAARAWALLSKLVEPNARRLHCMRMAVACGYRSSSQERLAAGAQSELSRCCHLGKALKECSCQFCKITKA